MNQQRVALCPGSFDPVTLGHVDVIVRAARLFDRLVVACLRNVGKSPMFDLDERVGLLREVVDAEGVADRVEVAAFDGLMVDMAREVGAVAVIKGVRNADDVAHELPMAHMNAHLSGIETVWLPTSPAWSFVSSSLVKEVSALGGDIDALVPPSVVAALDRRSAHSTGTQQGG